MFQSINPCTDDLIKEYPKMSASEIDEIIKSADIAFKNCENVGFDERAKLMKNAATDLNEKKRAIFK